MFGNAHTHDRLVRELAVGAEAAVVFPEIDLSPEARYPVAIEQNYTVAQWVVQQGASKGLDGSRLAVAGDSLRRQHDRRADPDGQGARRCPAAPAGPVLPGHRRELRHPRRPLPPVRGGLLPAPRRHAVVLEPAPTDEADRAQITASPLRATTEQLTGLPPALVITGEADVLRDEGEAYAGKLRTAGVPVTAVRFQGIIHDFVMLNALRGTHAAQSAITLAVQTLRTALHTDLRSGSRPHAGLRATVRPPVASSPPLFRRKAGAGPTSPSAPPGSGHLRGRRRGTRPASRICQHRRTSSPTPATRPPA